MIAEAEEKDPDERTQQEQAILDGEESVPFAWGPLSGYDGSICPTCFWVGILGSLLTGGVLAAYVSLWGYPLRILLPAWLGLSSPLLLSVLWLGRFPLFGAKLGPPVERFFARFGWYISAKARREYGGPKAAADGGKPQPYTPRAREEIVAAETALATQENTQQYGALWSIERDHHGNITDAHVYAPDSPVDRYLPRQDRVGVDEREHLGEGTDRPTSINHVREGRED